MAIIENEEGGALTACCAGVEVGLEFTVGGLILEYEMHV